MNLFTKHKWSLAAAMLLSLAACGGGGGGDGEGAASPAGAATGGSQSSQSSSSSGGTAASPSLADKVWVRLPGPSGDRTEIAIGGIKNEPANRVYMCEKKGSTAAGLYKGTMSSDNVVKWDAEHGLPDTYFSLSNGKLVFDYRINGSLPTDYEKGSWSGECGPLENIPPTQLTVVVPTGLTGIQGVTIDGKSVPLIRSGTSSNDCSNPSVTFTLPRPSKSNTNGGYYTVLVTDRTQSVDAGGAYKTTTYESTFYTSYFKAGACNTYKVEWGNMGYTLAPI